MREENFFDFQEVKDEGNMLMLELSAYDNQYEIIPLDDEQFPEIIPDIVNDPVIIPDIFEEVKVIPA